MAVKFLPVGDRVLVSIQNQDNSIEGVLMPDSAKQDMLIGMIVSVGSSQEFVEGDVVLFGPFAGKNIQIDGTPFRVMRLAEIDGKVQYAAGSSSLSH